jgi:hypothetical protein
VGFRPIRHLRGLTGLRMQPAKKNYPFDKTAAS